MGAQVRLFRIGDQQERERQFARVDQETAVPMRTQPVEQLGPLARDLAHDPVEQRLQGGEGGSDKAARPRAGSQSQRREVTSKHEARIGRAPRSKVTQVNFDFAAFHDAPAVPAVPRQAAFDFACGSGLSGMALNRSSAAGASS